MQTWPVGVMFFKILSLEILTLTLFDLNEFYIFIGVFLILILHQCYKNVILAENLKGRNLKNKTFPYAHV